MKKVKNKSTMVLTCILSVVLILFAAAAVYFTMIVKDRTEAAVPPETEKPALSEQGGQEKPQQTQGLDAVRIDLVETTVYRFDDLNFQFAIAKIRVKAKEPIRISLEHFTTDEGVNLNEIDEYLDILDKKGLYIGKQNVTFELISQETSYTANIFIPVRDKNAESAQVKVDFGSGKPLKLDLKQASGTKEMLGYVAEDIITDGKTYQMQIGSAFQIASEEMFRTFEDGSSETAGLPSTAEVFVFRLDAVSLWGDEVVVEDAVYTAEGSDTSFQALPSGFYSEKYDNILDRKIKEKDSGVLFFVTYNPEREPITYRGKLKVKLKGQENWIEITVSL